MLRVIPMKDSKNVLSYEKIITWYIILFTNYHLAFLFFSFVVKKYTRANIK